MVMVLCLTGRGAHTESGQSGSETETETECNREDNERGNLSDKNHSASHLPTAHVTADSRAPTAGGSTAVSGEGSHLSPLSRRLSPELLPGRAVAPPHSHGQGAGRGKELSASSKSLKSDLYSSSFESSRSISEGRGFTLSPIHSSSVVATQMKEMSEVDHTSSSSPSPSPSPSPELVSLTQMRVPGQVEGKRSGNNEANTTKGHRVKAGAEGVDEESAVSPHIPAVEPKGLLTAGSRSEARISAGPARRGGGDGEQSTAHVHLPPTQPRARDTPHSDPTPQGGASHTRPQGGGPQRAPGEEDEHLPGPVTSAAQVPPPTELQGRERGQRREGGEEAVRESSWMREVGKDLEKELGELQHALQEAGLPRLGDMESSDSDDTLRNSSPTSPASVSPRHALPRPRQQHQTQRQGRGGRTIPSMGGQQSGSSGRLESAIRALAAEELTSITKGLLLQDREGGGSGEGEGRTASVRAGGKAERAKAVEHKKPSVRIPTAEGAVGGVQGEGGRDGRAGRREGRSEKGAWKPHSPAAQPLKQTLRKDMQRSVPTTSKTSVPLTSHPATRRRGSPTSTTSGARKLPPKLSSAPHTRPDHTPRVGVGRSQQTLPPTAGTLARRGRGRGRGATAVARGEGAKIPSQRTQGSVGVVKRPSGEEQEEGGKVTGSEVGRGGGDVVEGSWVDREGVRESGRGEGERGEGGKGEGEGGGKELEILRSEVEKWKQSWTEEKVISPSLPPHPPLPPVLIPTPPPLRPCPNHCTPN